MKLFIIVAKIRKIRMVTSTLHCGIMRGNFLFKCNCYLISILTYSKVYYLPCVGVIAFVQSATWFCQHSSCIQSVKICKLHEPRALSCLIRKQLEHYSMSSIFGSYQVLRAYNCTLRSIDSPDRIMKTNGGFIE